MPPISAIAFVAGNAPTPVTRRRQSHPLGQQTGQSAPLGQAHQGFKAAVGDQRRVVERGRDRCGSMERLHVEDALPSVRDVVLEKHHHRRSQGIFLLSARTTAAHQPVDPG
jgi:hypothetical protein